MRSLTLWLTAYVVTTLMTAAVSSATVWWLYQGRPAQRAIETYREVSRAAAVVPPKGTPEWTAYDFLTTAGRGYIGGALARSSVPQGEIVAAAELQTSPVSAARIPTLNSDSVRILVWAEYLRQGHRMQGAYLVDVAVDKVVSITGPIGPTFPLGIDVTDETGQVVAASHLRSGPHLLIAPRRPAAELGAALTQWEAEYRSAGLTVVLVLDGRSPAWGPAARQAGFQGPIWRTRAALDDLPVVLRGEYHGAVGLMVDAAGMVRGPFCLLDPARYGLLQSEAKSVMATVLKAYGLLPKGE
jgi:hypothetical protein